MNSVTFTDNGFVVDAQVLGAAFDLQPADVPARLRSGEITSRCEAGIEEDAGRWRLTFYSGGRALRLVVDERGVILSCATFPAHEPKAGPIDERKPAAGTEAKVPQSAP